MALRQLRLSLQGNWLGSKEENCNSCSLPLPSSISVPITSAGNRSSPVSLLFCLALDPHSPGAGLGKGTLSDLIFIKQVVRLPLARI